MSLVALHRILILLDNVVETMLLFLFDNIVCYVVSGFRHPSSMNKPIILYNDGREFSSLQVDEPIGFHALNSLVGRELGMACICRNEEKCC